MNDTDQIRLSAKLAQSLILQPHKDQPSHSTFEQLGFLDGCGVVEDYLNAGEHGCAIAHLLYMINESDITFPMTDIIALHQVAKVMGQKNPYTRDNKNNLPEQRKNSIYNIPD